MGFMWKVFISLDLNMWNYFVRRWIVTRVKRAIPFPRRKSSSSGFSSSFSSTGKLLMHALSTFENLYNESWPLRSRVDFNVYLRIMGRVWQSPIFKHT